MVRKKTLKEFVNEANAVHGNKYDYSKFQYVNNQTKSAIKCSIHGIFFQRPNHHLQGQGCPDCGIIQTSKTKTKTIEDFIIEAKQVHGDRFDYSKFQYKGNNTKSVIGCPIHGDFLQRPTSHLCGYGCKKCADEQRSETMMMSQQKYIHRCREIHSGKYDYSKVEYTGTSNYITIVCPKSNHGEFIQMANEHIRGRGCPKCGGAVSKISQEWLDAVGIPKKLREKTIHIDGKIYRVDGYDPLTKTIYEFYGDYWHGNLKVFDKNKLNIYCKKTFEELHSRTIKRENILKKAGFKVVSIWEKDFRSANAKRKTITKTFGSQENG